MRKTVLVLVLCAFICGTVQAAQVLQPSLSAIKLSQAQILRTPQLLQSINKIVTIKGFFYDGSIPMIVSDMELIRQDRPLPPDAYVPLAGPRPSNLKWGDKIEVKGKLEAPSPNDPPDIKSEAIVIRPANVNKIKVLKASPILASLKVVKINLTNIYPIIKTKYAVLIVGGINSANNHIRYWNDLKTMYSILRARGFDAANIYVLYANGVPRDSSTPVHYSATRANVSTVFTQLASKVSAADTVYIMLNDHGGTSGSHSTLCLWGEDMLDSEFATQVNKINNYDKIIIQMKQCFSGGFIDDLTKPKRIVMSSCTPTQVSYAKSTLDFGEFTFWYFSALTGNKPDGSGSVNADANSDGKISIMEAWNFARSHDSAPETPQYEDNGVPPPHGGGSMPMGGDGPLGAATWL